MEVHKEAKYLNKSVIKNLRKFNEPSKFKKLTLEILVDQLKLFNLERIKTTFDAIDLDSSGRINEIEMRKAFFAAGYNE